MTYIDEFTGNKLSSNWTLGTGPRNNATNRPNAVTVANNTANLTVYTENNQHYAGWMQSNRAFEYGYFEIRARVDAAPGAWFAGWLFHPSIDRILDDPAAAGVEADIFEIRKVDGSGTDISRILHQATHYNGYGAEKRSAENDYSAPGMSFNSEFHVYGLAWTKEGYRYFVDGNETWAFQGAVSHRPQHVMLTSEVLNNSWAGTIPIGGYGSLTSSTTRMQVDYVPGATHQKLREKGGKTAE